MLYFICLKNINTILQLFNQLFQYTQMYSDFIRMYVLQVLPFLFLNI